MATRTDFYININNNIKIFNYFLPEMKTLNSNEF